MLLNRGEILDIIDEKLSELYADRMQTIQVVAQQKVLEQLKEDIRKREEG